MKFYPFWKIVLIIIVLFSAFVFSIPTFIYKDNSNNWFYEKKINLGLDLQGGSHLLLEVKSEILIEEEINNVVGFLRQFIRDERIKINSLKINNQIIKLDLLNLSDINKIKDYKKKTFPDIKLIENNNFISLSLTDSYVKKLNESALKQSLEIVRKRIDESGTKEPLIQRQGINRILLQLPGIKNPERIKALLGKTAKLTFHMVDDENPIALSNNNPPPGKMIVQDFYDDTEFYLLEKRIRVGGESLVDAQPTYEQNTPAVSFRFNPLGARKFGKATSNNVGKRFAIILDNKVITAPVIRTAITGGTGVITGNFAIQEAQDLSILLRAGALPAPLEIIEERSVGPGLGIDSINAGKIASITGLILVCIFMFLIYGLMGLVANAALIANLFIIISALGIIGATLTLPGIAGIVLTIGMAVDANVLIFERIKEESRNNSNFLSAINTGYSKAISTILDANITTLIASILLFIFGSGPVKGFAVTLSIGVISSMFTAITLTNFLIILFRNRIKLTESIKNNV